MLITDKMSVVGVLLCGITLISAQCLNSSFPLEKVNDLSKLLYEGQMRFTTKLFDQINKAAPSDNIFFSPYSVYHTLLLAYLAAGGNTATGLSKALEIKNNLNKEQIMRSYQADKHLRKERANEGSFDFVSANKLFVDQNLDVKTCAKQFFNDELELKDFQGKAEQSRQEINDWVAKLTKNQIVELLPEDSIGANSKLVLANAAYFKDTWQQQFQAEKTKPDLFYASRFKRIKVPYMNTQGYYSYNFYPDLGAQILEMPYESSKTSMFIILPTVVDVAELNHTGGVDIVIERLTPELLRDAFDQTSISSVEVILQIPKFTVEKTVPLRNVLNKMGVGDLFDHSSNFTELSDDDIDVDEAIHKAKIIVNEEGTEAAGASGIWQTRSLIKADPIAFRATSPFIYVIYEHDSQSVLFMGVCRDPKSTN